VNRRELLTAFLGAPAAIAACSRRVEPGLPPGTLAFQPETLGHRLRSAFAMPVLPEARRERVRVLVVGAGAAGLSAAWRLARAGVEDFVVLELDDAPGGTARGGNSAVSAFPWGAHYLTVPMREHRALIGLLSEMGVVQGTDAAGDPVVGEEFLCREPEERLFYKGRWYEGLWLRAGATPEDTRQKNVFDAEIARWAAWRDGRGRRAFAIPTATASNDAEVMALDRSSMAAWMDERGFTSSRLRWLVDYACRDDYGSRLEDTSAWAGIFYFASRLRAANTLAQAVITWPEGNARLIAHLAKSARGKLRTGLVAADLARNGNAVDVLAMGATPEETRLLTAERVIFAGPRFSAVHAIREWRAAPPRFAAEFQYAPWVVANLTVRERPREGGYPLAWDNVLYDSPALGYVVATHQRGVDHGAAVFTWYYPLCGPDRIAERKRALAVDRDGWAEIALADLGRAHPDLRGLVDRIDVARWGHAMIAPRPGFIASAARREAREPLGSIHFAHTDLSGVALFEEAFDHGVRAAEEVLSALGHGEASLR